MGKRPKRKHVPRRTCIACRAVRSKRELVRVVRTPEGSVVVDETGKRNGRGAYLCRQRDCWESALARNHLERALKTTLTAEARAELREYARVLACDHAAGMPPRLAESGEDGNVTMGASVDE
jgi:predicted RNA-binding protein YlxR (DUF448 family)